MLSTVFLHMLMQVTDEWVRRVLVSFLSAKPTILQISRWDEQRENGTFPASLEP